jgi:flavorubredoxin
MWQGTRRMAEFIAKGIREIDETVTIKLLSASKYYKNDIITDVFKSKLILMGFPTFGKGLLTSIAAILEEIKGLGFKDKKAASFSCYGWSGEAVNVLNNELKKAGFSIINDGIRALWNPADDAPSFW